MKYFLVLAVHIVLSGCGERASTFDEKTGRYIPTDDYTNEKLNEQSKSMIAKRKQTNERSVHRITTAAYVWLTACIGAACGVAEWPTVLISLPIVLTFLAFGGPAERAISASFDQATESVICLRSRPSPAP